MVRLQSQRAAVSAGFRCISALKRPFKSPIG
uniref:Uncharacterized protein n=1 Tax=Anguilla anguilla TaxID=7936 RepID=A0A0E9Q873_ANGAN